MVWQWITAITLFLLSVNRDDPFLTFKLINTLTCYLFPQDLKEKKEVTEEVEVEKEKENGSGDAPANGNGTVSNVASQ